MIRMINPSIKREALDYFFTHDITYINVVREFNSAFVSGSLIKWAKDDVRFKNKKLKRRRHTNKLKTKALMLYNKYAMSVPEIAKKLKMDEQTIIYYWIKKDAKKYYDLKHLCKEESMTRREKPPKDKDSVEYENYMLRLENDILRARFEIIDDPKVMGLKAQELSVLNKTKIVTFLRPKHYLKYLLDMLHLTKSSYDYVKVEQDKGNKG
jgi:transposase-like protein